MDMRAEATTFQQALEAIRKDRVHGASFLGQRAVWALALAASEAGAPNGW